MIQARPEVPLTHPFAHVVFDADSTLSIEGLDVLATRRGIAEQIKDITEQGMSGGHFYGGLMRRLDLLRPTEEDMQWLAGQYVEGLVPGARETIAALHRMGKEVRIVSGGFIQALEPMAKELGVEPQHVYANTMWFNTHTSEPGQFCGFDPDNELAHTGGKPRLLKQLQLEGPIVNIGDGSTDAQIKTEGVSERFILFAGLTPARESVMPVADAVVEIPDLRAVLPHILTPSELAECPEELLIQEL